MGSYYCIFSSLPSSDYCLQFCVFALIVLFFLLMSCDNQRCILSGNILKFILYVRNAFKVMRSMCVRCITAYRADLFDQHQFAWKLCARVWLCGDQLYHWLQRQLDAWHQLWSKTTSGHWEHLVTFPCLLQSGDICRRHRGLDGYQMSAKVRSARVERIWVKTVWNSTRSTSVQLHQAHLADPCV